MDAPRRTRQSLTPSPPSFRTARGRRVQVMVGVLLILGGVLLFVPFVRTVWLLHLTWFCLGLCTATLDTGCQIMTRKVHGLFAGPWLALNTMCFAAAGIITPLVDIASKNDVFVQCVAAAPRGGPERRRLLRARPNRRLRAVRRGAPRGGPERRWLLLARCAVRGAQHGGPERRRLLRARKSHRRLVRCGDERSWRAPRRAVRSVSIAALSRALLMCPSDGGAPRGSPERRR